MYQFGKSGRGGITQSEQGKILDGASERAREHTHTHTIP